jgi:hypothetical protein
MNQVTTAGYQDVISRAAQDPNFDVDKLERLVAMQEAQQQRQADQQFNNALAAAEAEMEPIRTDANNPQTRSRFATFGRLDSAARPIYTKHGFGVSWNTEPSGDPNIIRTVGTLTNGMTSRRYQWDNPIETKGAKGTEFTTRTWAQSSAFTYSKRILLTAMFNLAVSDLDDDGATAGGRRQPPTPRAREHVDPQTGEVTTAAEPMSHQTPGMIDWQDGADTWATWAPRFTAHLRTSNSLDEVQQWWDLNTSTLNRMKEEKPASYENISRGVEAFKKGFK